ncbi:MAG: Hsp70 family protein [Chthoniobacteraceae bacterium]|nr:Hsp70 family protein [Chthoniobacteraceae bacterium]
MIVGIDLGTTNSLVGVFDAGFVSLIADEFGQRLTPSVVHFPVEGVPLVGRPAQRLRVLSPERTVFSSKRFMGRRVGEDAAQMPYQVVGNKGAPVMFDLGERRVAPENVAAEILRKLKQDAERALGESVTKAVVTVPAYFNDAQRAATKLAGELAGLDVVRILNEPTAAALAYGMDRRAENTRIAVYDFGGGTFDVSILELQGGVFQVLSTNGNTRLGGDDIDSALVDYVETQLSLSASTPTARARLLEALVVAKHGLSEAEEVSVSLPFLDGLASPEVLLSRAVLEMVARPWVEKTRGHCLRALSDAHLKVEDIAEVILVGGSTRMPLVRRFVAEVFQREPDCSRNPDEAVAEGAALQGAILDGKLQHVVLLDVTPLSLGIETFGGLMNVILPRNSTIPCKAGEMFTNALPGQRSMLIRVLQGERELADANWELGRFEIPFTPLPKGQARVGVQFEIDANGILKVLARETTTGKEQVVDMQSAVEVSDEAVEKMLEDALEHAFDDMNQRAFTEAKLKAQEMLPSVAKALGLAGDSLDAGERERIEQGVRDVQDALRGESAELLKRSVAELDDATQRLAAVLMERAMRR